MKKAPSFPLNRLPIKGSNLEESHVLKKKKKGALWSISTVELNFSTVHKT